MSDPPPLEIPVALVRDYQQINREVLRALDAGHPVIRLTDVEGQRLLAAGLRGPWEAVIEVVGDAGPEVAADLDAPDVTILCRGSVADGAGRGLRAGRIAVEGAAGDAAGAWMSGGALVVAGAAGHRAGLRQRGGTLVLLGAVGRLPADRQSGGVVFAPAGAIEGGAGRGRSGGLLIPLPGDGRPDAIEPEAEAALRRALEGLPERFRVGSDGEMPGG